MTHNTNIKHLTVEEHVVTFGRMDLVEMLDAELAGEGVVVAPSITHVCVAVGKEMLVGSKQLMEMLRGCKEDIPEDAELVLAVRWRKEVSSNAVRPAGTASPAYTGVPVPVQTAGICATCQATPAVEGPTPDCEDAEGCAMVRSVKGDMPIVKTQEPKGGAQVGQGGQRVNEPPPGVLVNRETGQRAFADGTGNPYGVHEDYQK